jgi:RHS repeat-associated protein
VGICYRYSVTNRILRINEQASDLVFKLKGFRPKTEANGSTSTGGIDYTYDANGNQTSDPHKGITSIQYNYLNLPVLISYADGRKIEQRYDAAGILVFRWMTGDVTTPANNYFQTYIYGLEYRGGVMESVAHQEGRLFNTVNSNTNASWRYEYNISDHLGNTRLTFTDKAPADGIIKVEDGEVLEEAHYYPFGLAMEGPWMNDAAALDTRYKFNGIERIQDFGLNVDMAIYRAYDPAIGRWWQADPVAKAWENPYAAMYNNPMNWSDFLGADPSKGDTTLPEVMVTAKRSVNNAPINNLQIDGDFVYFQQGKSWYMYTQAPLEEGGTRTYGYDARAGWVFVRSDYESYKARLSAAVALADMMSYTMATVVSLFMGGGLGATLPANAGLRTVPIAGRYAARASAAKGITNLIGRFSSRTIEDAVAYAMKNKVDHVFGKAAHNLEQLVTKLGGHENTFRAVLKAANGKFSSSGLFNISVNIGGHNVMIRGSVVNGIPKIGTMFIP